MNGPHSPNAALNGPIRLVLLNFQVLLRESLARFLSAQPGFEVVAQCGTSAEVLSILKDAAVDLVLADFDTRVEDGNAFISDARKAGFQGGILIVTDVVNGRECAAALKLGGSGIFLKSKPLELLTQAVRLVAMGEAWVDEAVVRVLAHSYPQHVISNDDLTVQEREVLNGLLEGLTSRNIGTRIGRSEGAVKAILQQLFAKAGVRSRSQLVRVALEGQLGMNPAANLSINFR